jgi:hypothetical protein
MGVVEKVEEGTFSFLFFLKEGLNLISIPAISTPEQNRYIIDASPFFLPFTSCSAKMHKRFQNLNKYRNAVGSVGKKEVTI